jgi:hypothetical protein
LSIFAGVCEIVAKVGDDMGGAGLGGELVVVFIEQVAIESESEFYVIYS